MNEYEKGKEFQKKEIINYLKEKINKYETEAMNPIWKYYGIKEIQEIIKDVIKM